MKERSLTVLTDCVLITCIVQKGIADTIVRAAREAGAQGATIFYAKGTGVRERLGLLGVAVEVDTPGMGFMYCSRLEKAATYIPPAVVEKIQGGSKTKSEPQAA